MKFFFSLGKKVTWFFLKQHLEKKPMSLKTLTRFEKKLPVFIDQHTCLKIYWGFFEKKETRFLEKNVEPDDVCLDIGANIGYYSALFASKSAKVIAIDPVARNAALISLAQTMNRDEHVQVILAAVSHKMGQEEFIEHSQTSLSGLSKVFVGSSIEPEKPNEGIKYIVDTITIDSLKLERLNIVKIDIEGAEYEALLGMSETVKKTRPRLFMIELVEDHLKRAGHSLDLVLEIMESWGYDAMVMGKVDLEIYCGSRPLNDNFFFIAR